MARRVACALRLDQSGVKDFFDARPDYLSTRVISRGWVGCSR